MNRKVVSSCIRLLSVEFQIELYPARLMSLVDTVGETVQRIFKNLRTTREDNETVFLTLAKHRKQFVIDISLLVYLIQ